MHRKRYSVVKLLQTKSLRVEKPLRSYYFQCQKYASLNTLGKRSAHAKKREEKKESGYIFQLGKNFSAYKRERCFPPNTVLWLTPRLIERICCAPLSYYWFLCFENFPNVLHTKAITLALLFNGLTILAFLNSRLTTFRRLISPGFVFSNERTNFQRSARFYLHQIYSFFPSLYLSRISE